MNQRVCFLMQLKRDRIGGYLAAHATVWPEMLDVRAAERRGDRPPLISFRTYVGVFALLPITQLALVTFSTQRNHLLTT